MTELLTWEEIERRYPDEWVIVENPEGDNCASPLTVERVLYHGKDREAVESQPIPPSAVNIGYFFTGALSEPGVVYIL